MLAYSQIPWVDVTSAIALRTTMATLLQEFLKLPEVPVLPHVPFRCDAIEAYRERALQCGYRGNILWYLPQGLGRAVPEAGRRHTIGEWYWVETPDTRQGEWVLWMPVAAVRVNRLPFMEQIMRLRANSLELMPVEWHGDLIVGSAPEISFLTALWTFVARRPEEQVFPRSHAPLRTTTQLNPRSWFHGLFTPRAMVVVRSLRFDDARLDSQRSPFEAAFDEDESGPWEIAPFLTAC